MPLLDIAALTTRVLPRGIRSTYDRGMKKMLALISLVFVMVLAPATAQAASPLAPRNAGFEGVWTGTSEGFENGVFVSREVRFTIVSRQGAAFTGTKSWREKGGEWSAPEPFQGVFVTARTYRAVDGDGYLTGTLVSPTRIRGTYQEAGSDAAAYTQILTKISR